MVEELKKELISALKLQPGNTPLIDYLKQEIEKRERKEEIEKRERKEELEELEAKFIKASADRNDALMDLYRTRIDYLCRPPSGTHLAATSSSPVLNDEHNLLFGQKPVVSISSLNSRMCPQILAAQRLTIKLCKKPLVPSHQKRVEEFQWDDRQESAQVDRYLGYLRQNVTTPRSMAWVNGNCHKNMLLTDVAQLPFVLKGTADVAICARDAVRSQNPALGLHVLFELKKVLNKQGHNQAVGILVAANILCGDTKPVVVLTDLANDWHLYWVNARKIYTLPLERAVAIGLVEDLLEEDYEDEEIEDVTMRVRAGRNPLLDREKMVEIAGADALDGDIANIGDLEGLIPREEMNSAKQRLVFQAMQRVPIFRQMWLESYLEGDVQRFKQSSSLPPLSMYA